MPVEDAVEQARADLAQVPRVPGAPKPDALLVADHVRRSFGGVNAVDVEHLEVQRNVITALIGPNGAGKTTLFNLMTGFDKPDTGHWTFDGTSLAGVAASRVAKSGMVRTFQLTKALARMTVLDNMRLGAREQPGERLFAALVKPLWAPREREITDKALSLLERFKLDTKKDDFAGSLSGGQRKLLEMARALMSDPRLVMLDEPVAGVNPTRAMEIADIIKSVNALGTTFLIIEHNIPFIMRLCDSIIVMDRGKRLVQGTPDEIRGDPAVLEAYLGGAANVGG